MLSAQSGIAHTIVSNFELEFEFGLEQLILNLTFTLLGLESREKKGLGLNLRFSIVVVRVRR